MRRTSFLALSLLVVIAVSCESPRVVGGFVEVPPNEFDALAGINVGTCAVDAPPARIPEAFEVEPTEHVRIEARLLRASPDDLAKLGFEEEALRALSSEEVARLGVGSSLHSEGVGSLMRIRAKPGEASSFVIVTQAAYIQDITMKRGETEGEFVAEPKIGVLGTGVQLDVLPNLTEDGIEISQFAVHQTDQIGTRTCLADLPVSDVWEECVWQEPVVLSSTLRDDVPEKVVMKSGGSIIARMKYELKQPCATARAYAREGRVKETYQNTSVLPEGQSWFNSEYVIVLTAERIAAKTPNEFPPPSSAAARTGG